MQTIPGSGARPSPAALADATGAEQDSIDQGMRQGAWSRLNGWKTLLTPSPDALACHVGRNGRGISGVAWFPLMNLIWLSWILTSPIFWQHGGLYGVLLSYAGVVVFLVLYYRAYYRAPQRLPWNVVGIAVLGLSLLWNDFASWSYLIYAGSLLMFCGPPRRTLPWLGVLICAFYVDARLAGVDYANAFSCVFACLGISLFNLYFRHNARRDAELRLSHDEVRRLAGMAERERIGRDLHDLLGHTLSLIAIKSELADRVFERDPQKSREELREVQRVAREALAEVRSAVTGFRASGLVAELASAKLLLESAGVSFRCERDELLQLSPPVEATLALCLREMATNIQRHARATQARFELRRQGAEIEMSLRDDGRGGADLSLAGNGLSGLQARVRAIGGTLTLDSPRGAGTRVSIRLPRTSATADVADLDALPTLKTAPLSAHAVPLHATKSV